MQGLPFYHCKIN